jgi:hypothetical protein
MLRPSVWLKSAFSWRSIGTTLAILLGLSRAHNCLAGDTAPAPKVISLNSLSMEVNALQMLHQFNFDKNQLEKLHQWSEGSAQKEATRKAGKASKDCREKMLALRKAMQEAKDGDLIQKLNDDLNALREEEKPVFDDRVEVTPAARERAVEVYRLLKPNQLANYLGHIADEVADPTERLRDAMEQARAMNEEEWKEQRDEIAEDISQIIVGLDPVKSKATSEQVVALLERARGLAKDQFEKQQADLGKAARKISGEVSVEEVLRHHVELDLASLLSNPRLPQASRALAKSLSEANPEKKR